MKLEEKHCLSLYPQQEARYGRWYMELGLTGIREKFLHSQPLRSHNTAVAYTSLASDRIRPCLLEELCGLWFTLGQRLGVNCHQIKQDGFYEGLASPCQIPFWLTQVILAVSKRCFVLWRVIPTWSYHTTCGIIGIRVMPIIWLFVTVEHQLFTENSFKATMCCAAMFVGSGLCMYSRYEYVCVFVHVCWSLAVRGMPVKGRALHGSEAQSIPVI